MTEEESEVFEITDFTTASEWERFISRLEEVIHDLKLTQCEPTVSLEKGELSTGQWEERQEEIQFADFRFLLTRHFLKPQHAPPTSNVVAETPDAEQKPLPEKTDSEVIIPTAWQDMMSVDNDFPGKAHCLCRWYGLRDFVVLMPDLGMDDIMTESRARILWSSVAVAINNTQCSVPIFIAVHSKWRRLFQGHCEVPGFRTTFEMVHLKHTPLQYRHLSGLLDVFKAKLACPLSPVPTVSVAVRFTYVLHEWAFYNWLQGPLDIEHPVDEKNTVNTAEFEQLPFGACEDPVSDLQLSTTWPALSEEMVVDDDVYSDLNPLQAPFWSAKVRTTDDVQCLLGDYLDEFIHLCKRTESTDQLLGKSLTKDKEQDTPDVSQALNRLTDPAYNLSSIGDVVNKTTTVVTRATTRLQIKPEEAPIPADLLNQLLLYLFPDAKEELIKLGKEKPVANGDVRNRESIDLNSPTETTDTVSDAILQDMFKQLKSAPMQSLTYQLAVVMCVVNHSYGGVRAVAHLWQEFVLEMRYRLENNYTIPNLESGSPNMGCCLLHQKLQMLNCCIERKKARESLNQQSDSDMGSPKKSTSNSVLSKTKKQSQKSSSNEDGWECEKSPSISSDEEFFECEGQNEPMETSVSKNEPSDEPMEACDIESVNDQASSSSSNVANKIKSDTSVTNSPSHSKFDSVRGTKHSSQSIKDNTLEITNRNRNDSESTSGLMDTSSQDPDTDTSFTETWTHMPEGRRQIYLHLTLLNNPDEPLYVPITQEPAPMTEDMLEEHAEVLSKLGTSSEGMHLRARMQSACLLSDMESFKAANPGCILADFVRWYSPRDWTEKEEMDENGEMVTKYELSQRMQIPGNMWVEVWQSAKPVPARRQRRLFDDTKEAEKVLHWLASFKPADVAMRLMPMVVQSAISRLHEQEESRLPVVKTALDSLSQRATKVMRAPRLQLSKFEDVVNQVSRAEQLITRAQSLQQKLVQQKEGVNISSSQLQRFVSDLLHHPEVAIAGAALSPIGKIIHKLFQAAQKSAYMISEDDNNDDEEENNDDSGEQINTNIPGMSDSKHTAIPDFPKPAGKEYILRTSAPRPAPWSRASPHRLYAILLKNEFRLLGAFTSDTTFQ